MKVNWAWNSRQVRAQGRSILAGRINSNDWADARRQKQRQEAESRKASKAREASMRNKLNKRKRS